MALRRRSHRTGPRRPGKHSRHRPGEAPGDRFEATVRDLASTGEGIVQHPGGRIFFVDGVWLGEHGRFAVESLRGRHGRARLIALTHHHPGRLAPPCPHHGFGAADCGGCPWQFMDYAEQCAAKEARLRRDLEPLGLEGALRPLLASPQALGYRNRAQLKTDGQRIGYVQRSANRLAPIDDCLILNTHNRDLLRALIARLPCSDWQPSGRQPWTSLDIDDDMHPDQVAPALRRPFRQGNSAQNVAMREWLAAQLPSAVTGPAVELFAGSGNFTEILSSAGISPVFACDAVEAAIAALTARALPGVEAAVLDLSRSDCLQRLRTPLQGASLLLLDPPREGFPLLGEALANAAKLSRMIYISCNPATFLRDLRAALDAGFEPLELQPLDLFPQTPHVEILASLIRR